jgi:glycosyltransferase involved in cell wall biosynthesis
MRKLVIILGIVLELSAFRQYNFAPKIVGDLKEKKFVIGVPSYNNEKYLKRNLNSIFMQNYTNYRVIYVDDASTDNTWEMVNDYFDYYCLSDKIILLHNSANKGAMYNHISMIEQCEDDEIYVSLDGDDWFAHKNVLRRLNQAYADEKVWMTYGSWVSYPTGISCGDSVMRLELLDQNFHREIPFIWLQPRTFYAKLFSMIPVEKFKDNDGNFFSQACDTAYMFNLLDMVGSHAYYIPEILYVYNNETELNDHKKALGKQLYFESLIRSRAPLKKIQNWRDK